LVDESVVVPGTSRSSFEILIKVPLARRVDSPNFASLARGTAFEFRQIIKEEPESRQGTFRPGEVSSIVATISTSPRTLL
jgi:hypothetical protein